MYTLDLNICHLPACAARLSGTIPLESQISTMASQIVTRFKSKAICDRPTKNIHERKLKTLMKLIYTTS